MTSTVPASMGGPLSEAERIAEIQARLDAATPGPWHRRETTVLGPRRPNSLSTGPAALLRTQVPYDGPNGLCGANAELTANAPADLEFLLSRVGVLEGQLATAQTEVVIRDGAIVGRDKAINSLESWRRNWNPIVDAHMQAAATYREYAAAMNIDRVWDELPTYEQCAWRAVVRAVSTPLTNDITWLISEIGYDHWDSCQFDDDTDGDYCTLCDGYSDLRDKYETKRTRS